MTFTPEQLDRAKRQSMKLLALAREGIGGEKEKAGNLLASLMKKYGLKESDLILEGDPTWHWWTPADKWDADLLNQCIVSVTNTKAVGNGKSGKRRGYMLTAFQHAEVDLLFIVHKQAWRKEKRQLFIAYISRNELHTKTADNAPSKMPTPEEMAETRAIQEKMTGMPRTYVPRGMLTSTAPKPDPVDSDVSWAGDW